MNARKITMTLLMLVTGFCRAQVADDFSDGDFATNPTWQGDVSKFVIMGGRLKMQAPPVSGSASLVTASVAMHEAIWEITIQFDFNPSSSNYARVYLAADEPNLSGPIRGYFVKVGGSTRDIALFMQSGNTETRLIDGLDDRVNLPTVSVKIRVTREDDGQWELYSDAGLTGTFVQEGSATDNTHVHSSFFGIDCVYTSTRSDKFWFDDAFVAGTTVPETPPSSAARRKDVIISEIFPDPTPQIGLPNAEYLEILNRSENTLSLAQWTLTDGSSTGVFPSVTILPGEYRLVTASSSTGLFQVSDAIGISNFPSLNNAGDAVVIKDPAGVLIDSVNYTSSWYRDPDKEQGGWSLELIDPENPCSEADNWAASLAVPGGTPGEPNSILGSRPDLVPPSLETVMPNGSSHLMLEFNEPLMKSSLPTSTISISPGIEVTDFYFDDPGMRRVVVKLGETLLTRTEYVVSIAGIRDCSGNAVEPVSQEFGLPERADSMDVVINEILFNPLPGGSDFVELYNRSEKYVDLNDWTVSNEGESVVMRRHLLRPNTFAVCTSDPVALQYQYSRAVGKNIMKVDVPAMPDDFGTVILRDEARAEIDRVAYESSWHSEFLKSEEGVSLERIEGGQASQDRNNWISASSQVGFATPGFENSQQRLTNGKAQDEIMIVPEVFVPGASAGGFVQIKYKFLEPGHVANVMILNRQGALIRTISNNELIGCEGFFIWEGDAENGDKAPTGYYIVWFETFLGDGSVTTFRKRVVVVWH